MGSIFSLFLGWTFFSHWGGSHRVFSAGVSGDRRELGMNKINASTISSIFEYLNCSTAIQSNAHWDDVLSERSYAGSYRLTFVLKCARDVHFATFTMWCRTEKTVVMDVCRFKNHAPHLEMSHAEFKIEKYPKTSYKNSTWYSNKSPGPKIEGYGKTVCTVKNWQKLKTAT